MKKINLGLVFLLSLVLFSACGKEVSNVETDDFTVVKVGIVGEESVMWGPINNILEKDKIRVELVKFSDYNLPNQALADGEIDLNAFQHKAFLNSEIEAKGYDIVAIGDTLIAPLDIYSKNIKSLDEIKENDKIAIPNDVTNGGRALKVLEEVGLIKVKEEALYTPSIEDITENNLNLEIIQVDAAQLPALLPDVTAAVINGNYAHDYGLDPNKEAIYVQTIESIKKDNPYINCIVARTEDKDNPIYKKIVEAYQTDEVAKVVEETYGDLYLPAWNIK